MLHCSVKGSIVEAAVPHACDDILIVQVDPVRIEKLPTSAQAIRERVQVLAFNAGFLREMHAIAALGRLLDRGGRGPIVRARRLAGRLRPGRRPVRLHLIEAETEMARLSAASRLDPDEGFLAELFALGRERAETFLADHQATIGVRSSLDVAVRFA